MSSKLFKTILISFVLFIFSTTSTDAAPRLFFDPQSQTTVSGQEASIDLKIDVETQSAFGADVVINYPGSEIEITSVTTGGFFSDVNYANDASGTLEIHGFFPGLFETKSGSGTVATVNYKTNKTSGEGSFSFTCTGSGADTQILNSEGSIISNCNNLTSGAITYSTSSENIVIDNNEDPGTGDPNSCGGTCGSNSNCQSDLICSGGFCKNPSCISESSCECTSQTKNTISDTTRSTTSTPTTSPIKTFFSRLFGGNKAKDDTFEETTTSSGKPTTLPITREEELNGEKSEDSQGNLSRFLAYGLGILLLLLAIFFLVKKLKKKGGPPKPTDGANTQPVQPVFPQKENSNPSPPQ